MRRTVFAVAELYLFVSLAKHWWQHAGFMLRHSLISVVIFQLSNTMYVRVADAVLCSGWRVCHTALQHRVAACTGMIGHTAVAAVGTNTLLLLFVCSHQMMCRRLAIRWEMTPLQHYITPTTGLLDCLLVLSMCGVLNVFADVLSTSAGKAVVVVRLGPCEVRAL